MAKHIVLSKSICWGVTILFALLFTGCGQSALNPLNPPAVHAGPPPPPFTLHGEGVCPDGCVSQESPGNYLALRIGPQFGDLSMKQFTYTLPYDLHVTTLDAWLDVGFGFVNEVDTHLQILYPDGTWTEYFVQYDRHSVSLPGDVQRSFPVDLNLPQGTTVTIFHVAGNCFNNGVEDNTQSCPKSMDTIWRLLSNK
jgi:hypothetical protein